MSFRPHEWMRELTPAQPMPWVKRQTTRRFFIQDQAVHHGLSLTPAGDAKQASEHHHPRLEIPANPPLFVYHSESNRYPKWIPTRGRNREAAGLILHMTRYGSVGLIPIRKIWTLSVCERNRVRLPVSASGWTQRTTWSIGHNSMTKMVTRTRVQGRLRDCCWQYPGSLVDLTMPRSYPESAELYYWFSICV